MRVLAPVLTVLVVGCATTANEDFKNHAVVVSSSGGLLLPTGDRTEQGEEKFVQSTDPTRIREYARQLVGQIIAARKNPPQACLEGKSPGEYRQKVLLYIHGGLNDLSTSTERVNREVKTILEDSPCLYPVFLNWDSGPFGSYSDHLFLVRQGQEWPWTGWLAFPFEFLADLGRSVSRAILTWGTQIQSDAAATPYVSIAEKTARDVYEKINNPNSDFFGRVSLGEDRGVTLKTFGKGAWYVATYPFQFVTAPIIDGFGTPTWDIQLRRTATIFDKPGDFDLHLGEITPAEIVGPSMRRGALSIFMDEIRKVLETDQLDRYEFILVAHSMGAIIANRLVVDFPQFDYSRIVYMASADSIRNTYASVFPYLQRRKGSQFFVLSLHPDNEKEEMNWIGFIPRGSLLAWIDNYFTIPATHLDRTVGVWDNIIPTVNLIPDDVRKRVSIKSFNYEGCVTAHGDFGQARFWRESFWTPGQQKNGC